jgi:hypothetical protein
MSICIKTEAVCDHRILQDQLFLSPDMQTIKIPRTLSSSDVILRINGFEIAKDNKLFGWYVTEDPDNYLTKTAILVFNDRVKSNDNFYELDYSVVSKFCPKCLGLKNITDMSFNNLGYLNTVMYEEKLLQEIKKGISTTLKSNQFHEWIGTELNTLIGSKMSNVEVIKNRLTQDLIRYLEQYLDTQVQQAYVQDVDPREAYQKLLAIDVVPEYNQDLTIWTVSIVFKNRSGDDFLYEKRVSVSDSSFGV